MECQETLILGAIDKSEIQVLSGVDRLHGLNLTIQEGSADGDTKGAQPLTGGHHDKFKIMDTG
jgi:hypothetical protein